ncbi:DNA polymerase-3 subunit gamma/tau [Aeromonas sp. RU39B]|uniref:DNA polymerase III subunit gamma/tau n=1 Tax=Aeromonas sp. RU39B TaxID=1907416 RepID=UPI0009539EEA|nr:DNA polymerase III subunit gamma/tau [Aeromonas sp. RU39B]SIQ12534.1 DNA polymerase-3 subunit gamma/tau [Aeromonas sp. RU39B]
MSYQVLARKWRPRTFDQVVGQQHVLTALTHALDQGRLHHAYLLSGTRGVGKTTIARILAKSLNCERGVSSHPCGECDTCREVEQGNFVDLLEIDAASRTKVEDTRELLDNVQYRPARGRFKVYLIDEVHMLSRHSFNALLKTLEEPPPYVKFLLATTDPQKLPITILSRCLQFHLKSLDQTQIATQLEWVLDQEGQPFEPRALLALAKAADGSMRDALSLTDQALAHGNGSVHLESVLAMLGTLDHRHLYQLVEAVLRQDGPAAMAKVAEIATLGPDFDQLHAELESLLHRVAMAQLLPASVQEEGAEAELLLQLARTMAAEEVQLCYQIALNGRKELPWAPDGRSGLEMTVLRMLAFSPRRVALPSASFATMAQAVAPLGVAALSAPVVAPAPGKPETAPAEPEDPEHDEQALFAEQTELMAQAEQMGYQAEDTPASSAAPRNEIAPVVIESAAEPPMPEAPAPHTSGALSLLGKRNMLRSRLRGDAPAAAPAVTAAKPYTPPARVSEAVPAPSVVTPAPVAASPASVQQEASALVRPARRMDPAFAEPDEEESDGDSWNDYEAAMAQISWQPQAQTPVTPPVVSTSSDLPPWSLDDASLPVPQTEAIQPSVSALDADMPAPIAPMAQDVPVVEEPAARAPIDWDELESAEESVSGFGERLLPSSLLAHCGDSWSELISHTQVAGRLRQLAINSVMRREPGLLHLTLKPEQRHLVSERACQALAEHLAPALGETVRVEVELGVIDGQETPLEVEHRLYHQVLEQANRDMQHDPHVQFMRQRFGAELHVDSIEPLVE